MVWYAKPNQSIRTPTSEASNTEIICPSLGDPTGRTQPDRAPCSHNTSSVTWPPKLWLHTAVLHSFHQEQGPGCPSPLYLLMTQCCHAVWTSCVLCCCKALVCQGKSCRNQPRSMEMAELLKSSSGREATRCQLRPWEQLARSVLVSSVGC